MKNVFDLILNKSSNLVTLLSIGVEEDTQSRFKANVILVPTDEALKYCGNTYKRWYTDRDSKGFSFNLDVHDKHFYVRANNTPLAQSTKKRNVTDATTDQMVAAFRSFLKNIFKEMEKSQEAFEKQKKASWSLTQIAHHYEEKNGDRNHPFCKVITTQSNVSAMFNTNVDSQPLKKVSYNMLPSNINENFVSGEITLTLQTMSPEQLKQVLDKISEISALS